MTAKKFFSILLILCCGAMVAQTAQSQTPVVQNFTISFDAGGGSGQMASVQVASNEKWQLPQSTFTHPQGKAFKGWSAGGSEYQAGQKYTPTDDITFTALWSEAKYTGPSGIHYVEVGDSKTFTYKANEGWFYQVTAIQGLIPNALQFLSFSGINGESGIESEMSATEFTVTFAPTYFPEGSQTIRKGGYTYTITHCETIIQPSILWRNTGVGDYAHPIMDKFVVVPGRTSIDLGGIERYEIVLNLGAELQLNPVVRNIRNQVISEENGYTVDIPQLSFKSSNEDVATVSADGKITPEGGGKADIIISFIGNASYKAAEYVRLKVVVQEPVSVTGSIVWDDGDNIDGRRPEKTWLMIRRKDGETVVDKDGYTVAKEVEIAGTQGTKLSCTWENLPKYKQGTSGAELIEYEVVETSGDGMVWRPGGYEKLASGDMENGFVITNRYIPKQTDIVVTKVWEGDDNAGRKRPESVTLHLDQQPFVSTGDNDIKDVAEAVTANEANGWKAAWRGLPYNEKKSGQFTGAITYKVREDTPAGYTGAVTQTGAGLRASIVWADGVNEEDKPASITATLISEAGDATSRTAALSAANNWTCTFDELSQNQAARYTVSLSNPSLASHPERGYLQLSVIREYTLTNTLIPIIELTIDIPKCGTVVDEDKSYPFNPADGSRGPEAQSNRPVGTILTNGWEFVKSDADSSVDWLKWGPFASWEQNPIMTFPITLTGGSSYNALGRIVPSGGAPVPAAVSFVINGQELPGDRVKVDHGFIRFAAGIEAAHTLGKQARKEPSCTDAGYVEHWKCTGCGKLYSDENGENEINQENLEIPALSHDWDTPEYTWAEDNSTVTAKRICKRVASHEESETVSASFEETLAPTYTDFGEMTYTARFTNPAFETQTKVVPIAPLEPYGIEINEVNFPDEKFRQFVADNFDGIEVPGWLIPEELDIVKEIDCHGLGIADLTGIEHFSELEMLFCYENELSELDVTVFPKLRGLYCFTNQLAELDVTQNPLLEYLYCYNNALTDIDVSQNPALLILDVSQNQLTKLDVSQNPKLELLACYLNQIKGEAMDALIASLRSFATAKLHVIAPNVEGEQNVCTKAQVAAAKQKGWMSFAWSGTVVAEGEGEWLEYAGSDTPTEIDNLQLTIDNSDDSWFTLDGRKLAAEPKKKGVYVRNGRKVVKF